MVRSALCSENEQPAAGFLVEGEQLHPWVYRPALRGQEAYRIHYK